MKGSSDDVNGHYDKLQKEIGERKRLEAKLHTIESLFAETQRLAHLGSWDLDIASQKAVWSEELYRILGYEPFTVEASSANLLSRIHPDDKAHAMQELERPFQEKNREYQAEFRIVRPNKQVRTVAERGRVIYDEQGKARRYVGTTLDITERNQAEQERERLIEELEDKNEELERFVYAVSHELKTPLVTISGFAGILGSDVKNGNTDKVEANIRQITSAINTMSTLLEDLVDLSRLGRVVNPPEKFNFGDLVSDAVKSLSFQIAELDIDIKILPDLPVLHGDRGRLLEVLHNLIDNSIKFMGNQPEPLIEIGSRDDGPLVACYVRDNGTGIDPSYHEKVFGLFDRLDLQIDGTGVGLTLARRIVELHGGRIWIESEGPGKGSTIFFTIPRAE